MASRYSQSNYHSRSSGVYARANKSHSDLQLSSESMQAYDSNREQRRSNLARPTQHQHMDRALTRSSQPQDKDVGVTSTFSRWLGKHKPKNVVSTEKLRISEPQSIPAPQAPLRPKRSFEKQAPLPTSNSRILPEIEASKPLPKKPSVRKRNLGKSRDALGSYPIGAWLDDSEKTNPPEGVLLRYKAGESEESGDSDDSEDEEYQGTVRSGRSTPGSVDSIKPELPANIRAERRKGRIFLDNDPSKNRYEFPDPDTWDGEYSDESDEDDQFWDDAGFDDNGFDDTSFEEAVFGRRASNDGSIPDITISPPSDEGFISEEDKEPPRLLQPEDAYKVLCAQQKKQIRLLTQTQRYLFPLAWLVAEVHSIDPDDLPPLEKALTQIIADREKLFELFPLAQILANDQKVDVNNFKEFPRMLQNIMADRDNYKRLANYHRLATRKLESKVARLESELRGESPDEEDYIRL
ncbi:hypothetical protein F5Y11DRAFT_362213 [Daldinia sp. FL1419]|nr:hypothetical protein F5Y11DRAFT_362213 [Daldinia sp. FL1419]